MRRTLYVLLFVVMGNMLSAQDLAPNGFGLTVKNGISMGRWIYDKGLSEPNVGYHLGYDRSHLALYIPLGLDLSYSWKKWTLGASVSVSWLFDDELISSTSKVLVPREYFITEEEGKNISFSNYSLYLEKSIIQTRRYKLTAFSSLGSFSAKQTHPRKSFFDLHYSLDIGLSNYLFLGKSTFIMIRPLYKRKHIQTLNSPFPGESHDIISFGIDYGFGLLLF